MRDSGHEAQSASCSQQDAVIRDVLASAGATLARPPYRDEARPGSSTVGRKALEKLLADAQPGAADGVIFWSSSRMAREVTDAQMIRATLRKRGYRLVFVADALPNIGAWTPLLEIVQDIINAQYLEGLSKDVKRGHAKLLALGYAPTGKPPAPGYKIEREQYGTHRDGRPMTGVRWVKDPEEAAAVSLAWRMRARGHSYTAIHRLTGLYKNRSRYRGFFHNHIYRGVLVWGGKEYPGFVEPYVTPEQWDAVQAVNSARAAEHPRRLGSKRLLAGLFFCPVCGRYMGSRNIVMYKKKRQQPYYICGVKSHDWFGCPQKLVRADHIEQRVVEAVHASYYNPAVLEGLYAAWQSPADDGSERERARLSGEVEQGDKEIANLLKLARLGQFESVASELERLEGEQVERRRGLSRLEAQRVREQLVPLEDLPGVARELDEALAHGDIETARVLLARLVVRVDLDPDGTPRLTLRRPVQ